MHFIIAVSTRSLSSRRTRRRAWPSSSTASSATKWSRSRAFSTRFQSKNIFLFLIFLLMIERFFIFTSCFFHLLHFYFFFMWVMILVVILKLANVGYKGGEICPMTYQWVTVRSRKLTGQTLSSGLFSLGAVGTINHWPTPDYRSGQAKQTPYLTATSTALFVVLECIMCISYSAHTG